MSNNKAPERIYISESGEYLLSKFGSCAARSRPVTNGESFVQYIRDDNPWIPVEQMPEEWKDGRFLSGWLKRASSPPFEIMVVSIPDREENALFFDPPNGFSGMRAVHSISHVRLPSKGPV